MRHEHETFANSVSVDSATCPRLRLQIGDAILIEDTFFEILGSDRHGVNSKAIGSGRFQKTFEHAELFRLYYARKLKIQRAGFGRVRPVVARNLRKPIAAFSEADQDEALARYEYVQMFHRLYQAKKVKKTAEGYAKAIELTAWLRRRREAAEKGIPARAVGLECWSWSSLRNWYGDWVGSGCQLVALVPANASKGRHGTRLDPVVLRIVAKFVTERWLTLERPPLSIVHEEICCEVLRVNGGRRENQRLPEPDVNSVRRWIDSNFDEYEIVAARQGKDAADQRCRPVKAAPRGRWPGNIVELDHTRMDVFVVTQDGKPVTGDFETSRPWIMALICTLTRMILGFWITLEPPSWVTLMHCLRHAVLPKDVSHVPGIQSPYPSHGLFDLLRVDNDRIFRSRSLLLASAQLNFTIDWGPKGVSRMRGTIERHFRESNGNGLCMVPGKSFRSVEAKGDYDSEGLAAYQLREIRDHVTTWVVDYYHNKPNASLMYKTPLQMWNEMKQLGIRVADHVDDLEAILSLSFERTVQREGIRLFGLRYISPGLEKLLRRRHGKGVRYVVKVDPRDLTGVILYVDEEERWEHMACKTPHAVEGLDLQEWRDVCKLAWRMNRGTAPSRRIMLEARARLNQHAASKGAKPGKFRQQSDLDWYRENVDNPLWDVFGGGNDGRKATRSRKPSAEPQDIHDADELGIEEPAEDLPHRHTALPERSTRDIDLDDPANWGEPT